MCQLNIFYTFFTCKFILSDSFQVERLTVAQTRQPALHVEDTSRPPAVSLFPSELPSTPKRASTPPRAIEGASTSLEQAGRSETSVKDDTIRRIFTPSTESSGVVINNGVINCDAKYDDASDTRDKINILERPLNINLNICTSKKITQPDIGPGVNVAGQNENVPTDLCVKRSTNDQPALEQSDNALDLTLNKPNSDTKALPPTVENLGAGDSSEDCKL